MINNVMEMILTHPKHLGSEGQSVSTVGINGKGFGDVLADAIGEVSHKQTTANDMIEQMIINPDEVEIHDITTATSMAEMSMRLTKVIVDRAVKAYNDIIAMR